MMYKAFIDTVNEEEKYERGGLHGYFDTKETALAAAVMAMEGRFFYENAARDISLGCWCS